MVSRTRSINRRISAFAAAILVALAFGALAAGGAQAFEWEAGGHTLVERETTSEAVTGSGGSFQLNSTVLAQSLEMNCSSASTSGSIASGGSGSSALSLSGCTIAKPSGCAIKSPVVLESNVQLIEAGGVTYQKFTPKSESKFALLKITNCSATGNYALQGSFAGLGSQTEKLVDQPLSFSNAINAAAGTELKLGKQAAELAGTVEQHLSGPLSGRYWQVSREANPFNWQVGSSELTPGQTESIMVSGGPIAFDMPLFSGHVKFSCSGVSATNSRITFGGGSEELLTFTGCALSQPTGCTVAKSLPTVSLRSSLRNVSGYDYQTFAPTLGPTSPLMMVQIEGCSAAGSYQLTGSFTGKGTQDGVMATSQALEFSPTIDAAFGTWIMSGKAATTITGSMKWVLSGGGAGKEWGVS